MIKRFYVSQSSDNTETMEAIGKLEDEGYRMIAMIPYADVGFHLYYYNQISVPTANEVE